MQFDFSDHIVLAIVQFITPCMLEMGHIISASFVFGGVNVAQLVAIIASAGITLLQLRGLFFTSVYFHTPLENLVGLVIALISVLLPIFLLATSLKSSRLGALFRDLILLQIT